MLSSPCCEQVLFCHRPSRSLFVTDLWWNYPSAAMADAAMLGGAAKGAEDGSAVPASARLWKFGMDQIYKPFYNSFMAGVPAVFNAEIPATLERFTRSELRALGSQRAHNLSAPPFFCVKASSPRE